MAGAGDRRDNVSETEAAGAMARATRARLKGQERGLAGDWKGLEFAAAGQRKGRAFARRGARPGGPSLGAGFEMALTLAWDEVGRLFFPRQIEDVTRAWAGQAHTRGAPRLGRREALAPTRPPRAVAH